MKNSIYTLLILLLFSCKSKQVFAQSSAENLAPFIGVWESQTGNQIFRVNFYEDNSYLKGDYELVQVSNGTEIILYKSDYYVSGTNLHFGYAIYGGSSNGIVLGASIDDNSIDYQNGIADRKRKKGNLKFTIQSQNCTTCPLTAEWKVTPWKGIRSTDEPENYNIPTDIVMTKVE